MGVFKEHAYAFEQVASKQNRIFQDAADFGYAYDSTNPDPAVKLLIDMVQDLKGTSLLTKREAGKDWVGVTIEIGWEIDEGYVRGTRYLINYNRLNPKYPTLIKKGCDAFISVDVESFRKKAYN